ncbi:MAG: hypothetical protein GC154_16455 [bacterium]|nr:hypothetical protein [bacterium]
MSADEPAVQEVSYSNRRFLLFMLAVQTAVFVFNHFINFRPLWIDEAYSALMARLPFGEIHRRMIYDAGPPLYYDLLHVWRMLFGESELALRTMSLLFALLTTALLYGIALRFLNRTAARWTAAVWVVHPLSIYYATEARNYTLLTALAAAYVWLLLEYAIHRRPYALPAIAAVLAISVYNHNTAWYLAAAGGLASLLYVRDLKRLLPLFLAHLAPLAFYLPWIPVLRAQLQNAELTIGWIRDIWHPAAPLASLLFYGLGVTLAQIGAALAPSAILGLQLQTIWIAAWSPLIVRFNRLDLSRYRLFAGYLIFVLLVWPILMFMMLNPAHNPASVPLIRLVYPAPLLALWIVVWRALARGPRETQPGAIRWLLTFSALLLLFPWMQSMTSSPVYIMLRTDFIAAPFVVMAFSEGLRLASRWMDGRFRHVLQVAVMVPGLLFFAGQIDQPYISMAEAGRYILRQSPRGGVVICTGLTRPMLEYQLKPKGFDLISYPMDMANQLAHFNELWYRAHLDGAEEAAASIRSAKDTLKPGETLWVASSRREINRVLEDALHDDPDLIGSGEAIQSPGMGVRVLQERVYLLRYERK